jgi:hypothetical protein
MKTLLAVLLLICLIPATAPAGDLASLYVGANAAFFDQGSIKASFEPEVNAKVSLSGHLTLVGSVAYGVADNYWRSAVGGRVTTTDVDNRAFSVGLGIQHRDYSLASMGSSEWAPDVSIGYCPWPVSHPKVIVGAQGWYGLDSKTAGMELAARYQFKL